MTYTKTENYYENNQLTFSSFTLITDKDEPTTLPWENDTKAVTKPNTKKTWFNRLADILKTMFGKIFNK